MITVLVGGMAKVVALPDNVDHWVGVMKSRYPKQPIALLDQSTNKTTEVTA